MKNIFWIVSLYLCLISCANEQERDTVISEMMRILDKYDVEYTILPEDHDKVLTQFENLEEFERMVKEIARRKKEYLNTSKVSKHEILNQIKSNEERIDSIKKWVDEGTYNLSVMRETKTKSGEMRYESHPVPADSVEYYVKKNIEKYKKRRNLK